MKLAYLALILVSGVVIPSFGADTTCTRCGGSGGSVVKCTEPLSHDHTITCSKKGNAQISDQICGASSFKKETPELTCVDHTATTECAADAVEGYTKVPCHCSGSCPDFKIKPFNDGIFRKCVKCKGDECTDAVVVNPGLGTFDCEAGQRCAQLGEKEYGCGKSDLEPKCTDGKPQSNGAIPCWLDIPPLVAIPTCPTCDNCEYDQAKDILVKCPKPNEITCLQLTERSYGCGPKTNPENRCRNTGPPNNWPCEGFDSNRNRPAGAGSLGGGGLTWILGAALASWGVSQLLFNL